MARRSPAQPPPPCGSGSGSRSPTRDPALVAGRPVRSIDPQEGLFVDEEGNSYRLAGGGQAKPDYAEVIPVEGGRDAARGGRRADADQTTRREGNGLPVTGRRRRKGGEKPYAIPDELFSDDSRTGKS